MKKRNMRATTNKFAPSSLGAVLKVVVDDYDMGSGNDFMGQFTIGELGQYEDRKEVRKWFDLKEKDGKEPEGDIGSVLIAFRWVHNPDKVAPIDQPIDLSRPVFDCEDGGE